AAVIPVLDLVGVEHVDVRALDVAQAAALRLGQRMDADVPDLLAATGDRRGSEEREGEKGQGRERGEVSQHDPWCGPVRGRVTRNSCRQRYLPSVYNYLP